MKSPTLTCEPGDTVIRNDTGKAVVVAQILNQGCAYRYTNNHHNRNPGIRADITGYPIMSNGQILKRNPVYLGQDWHHKGEIK